MLDEKALQEFLVIWQAEFGEQIDEKTALYESGRLLELVRFLCPPSRDGPDPPTD